MRLGLLAVSVFSLHVAIFGATGRITASSPAVATTPPPHSFAPGAPAGIPDDAPVIPAGEYRPILRGPKDADVTAVAPFRIARRPVTNIEFLAFVLANPQWRKSRVSPLFAESDYLAHWKGDTVLGPNAPAASPVVYVSWFAARAYTKWKGGRLPSTAEWERADSAGFSQLDSTKDKAFADYVSDWLGHPTPAILPAVGSTPTNALGVQDLQGLIWEWVEDFNSSLVTGESRADNGLDRNLFCGAGSVGSADRSNYPAFMRAAFRSSLKANYCVKNLGFRCAWTLYSK